MPKIRTHSGTAKRIKTTKTGKLLHGHSSASHFLQKKSASRKRGYAISGQVEGKARTNIKRALGA
jgi:large subunit ribosomal protein L35